VRLDWLYFCFQLLLVHIFTGSTCTYYIITHNYSRRLYHKRILTKTFRTISNTGSKRKISAYDFWNTIAAIQRKPNTSTSKCWEWSSTRVTARLLTTTTSHCCEWTPMGLNSDPTPVSIRSVCQSKVTYSDRAAVGLGLYLYNDKVPTYILLYP